jgi:hypothetical protein
MRPDRPLPCLILSSSSGQRLQPLFSSPHASFLSYLTSREAAHLPRSQVPALPPPSPRNPTRPPASISVSSAVPTFLLGLHLHELASPPSTPVESATSSPPSLFLLRPWRSPLIHTAATAATSGHRRCYIRAPPLLPQASTAATYGRRRCYLRTPPLLPQAAVAATYGRHRCYLPTSGRRGCYIAVASSCRCGCYIREPPLLHHTAPAATSGRYHCYMPALPFLQVMDARARLLRRRCDDILFGDETIGIFPGNGGAVSHLRT